MNVTYVYDKFLSCPNSASTTHSKLTLDERAETGITDGMVRVSVGLEHMQDIIADVGQALG